MPLLRQLLALQQRWRVQLQQQGLYWTRMEEGLVQQDPLGFQ